MLPAAPLGAPSATLRALVGHGSGPAAVVGGAVVVAGEVVGGLVGLVVVEVDVGELEAEPTVVGGPVEVVEGVTLADLCAEDPHAASAPAARTVAAAFIPIFALKRLVGAIGVLTVFAYPLGV